jgi:hypothetical protein
LFIGAAIGVLASSLLLNDGGRRRRHEQKIPPFGASASGALDASGDMHVQER